MIIIIVTAILIIYVIRVQNSLVRLRNNAERSYSTIDVMLKKRFDLIPNLVASVKQYLTHEKDLLSKITELRSNAASGDVAERMQSDSQMSALLGKLNVSIEAYPDLKADKNVQQLQASLNETEEQIAAARSAYNGAVTRLNNKIESFPSSLIAGMFNFKQKEVFVAAEAEKENVNVGDLFGK